MKRTTKNAGLKVRTGLKAAGIVPPNHNRNGLKVKTGLKACGIVPPNHNRNGLRVKAGIKAGEVYFVRNHNARPLPAR